jgi:EAL domain-containing protein (putative c-di-GMP-specific phosphodiesterase class I)
MQDFETTIERLHHLKALGIRLAVDDFGTGYSSLGYLRRFPLDVLKIDRSFVDGLGKGVEEGAIARAVVRLAHSLNLEVSAEGIESAAQMEELRGLGCPLGQGFYFSKPMDPKSVEDLLRRGTLQLHRVISV